MTNLRTIPGFEGTYGMNPAGEVFRLESVDESGHVRKFKSLRATVHGRGYLYVRLSANGVRKMYSLNSLFRQTFPEHSVLLGVAA